MAPAYRRHDDVTLTGLYRSAHSYNSASPATRDTRSSVANNIVFESTSSATGLRQLSHFSRRPAPQGSDEERSITLIVRD